MSHSICRATLVASALIFSLGFAASVLAAADDVLVGREVSEEARIPLDRIDHAGWSALLAKYVDHAGNVDYAGWKASKSDQRALDEYLNLLSSAKLTKSASREVVLAFWINAYNAVTVIGILREYPTSSIRNHTAKVFGYNIWKNLLLKVDGNSYSLEDIEHKVLRKLGEPRVHFAIVCASRGCPPLRNEAYSPDKLDSQLTANAKAFFADRSKFSYDQSRRMVQVSPILKWFAEDFGTNDAERLRTIAPYLPDEASRQLARSGTASISFHEYDWGLNERRKGRQHGSGSR